MIPRSYTITHPRAVVIKLCYTSIAYTTVFRPHWLPYQAGTAEYTEVQTSCLCEFYYCLFLLFFCGFDDSWIRFPGFSKIVEKCNAISKEWKMDKEKIEMCLKSRNLKFKTELPLENTH